MLSIQKDVAKSMQKSTFLSCSKDIQTIIKKLFVDSKPYSDRLKKLLILNSSDCLTSNNPQYKTIIDDYSIARLIEEGYISFIPKIPLDEHEQMKSYIIIDFDDFVPSGNPEFRDCTISLTILCNLDALKMDNYELRPFMIAGYIDGILNESRLSGIGKLMFAGAKQIILDERISGIMLRYLATHSTDDSIEE